MDLSAEQVRWIIQALIILILSICVHEFGHAFVADKLGDPLPRSQGRTTLNPIAHVDPFGTLLFPFVALVFTKGASLGFGWGKPVQVSPRSFTRKVTMRTGHMLVAAAGPFMNLVLGMVVAAVHVILLRNHVLEPTSELNVALNYAVLINFTLLFFNLIPAPPLDGGAVLEGLLPARLVPGYRRISVFGPFVLLAVIFIPQLQHLFIGPAFWLYQSWHHLIGLPA